MKVTDDGGREGYDSSEQKQIQYSQLVLTFTV
jgi:hypothetical protein